MTEHIIVSRHPAAIEFIRAEAPEFADAPVVAQATAEDVAGRVVAGNLPLHLAARAAEVVAVEYAGDPPRGAEYSLAEMHAAGARLRRYTVFSEPMMVALAELERYAAEKSRDPSMAGGDGPFFAAEVANRIAVLRGFLIAAESDARAVIDRYRARGEDGG